MYSGIMPATLLSVADFAQLPDAPGKQELLEGELIELPPSTLPHSKLAKSLARFLENALGESRVYIEAGYQLSPVSWLQPDVSVAWPDQPELNDYLQGAPMIAIEIVSRGNTAEEIQSKTADYLNHGAAEVWIVYPRNRCLMVHKKPTVERVTASYRSELLPVAVPIDNFFQA